MWFKEKNYHDLIKLGIGGGLAEVIYVILVALLMFKTSDNGGDIPEYISIITVLLLFVLSAAVSGLFVLGYPAILALQHKYKEALITFGISLATIFLAFITVLAVMMSR